MMEIPELKLFLEQWCGVHPFQQAYICLPLINNDLAEDYLTEIRSMGYAAMIRSSIFGDEIVVTGRIGHV